MSDKDYRLTEIQFKQIHDRLVHNDTIISKIFDRLESMNIILTRNTTIVDEHQQRSTTLESMMDQFTDKLQSASSGSNELNIKIESMEKDLTLIKAHVMKVTGILGFLSSTPKVLKSTAMLLGIVTSMYGVFTLIMEITHKIGN